MLVTGLEILRKARAEGYGVGAFNTNNMEFTQAILEAAEEMKSPVILALSEGAMKYGGRALTRMVVALAQEARVPVAVHLDHGSSYESVLKALREGFTSVMIDKSHEDFETNVRETKRVVEAAHAVGVTVEAELGRLAGIEEHVAVDEKDALLTNPEEARIFMERTGADYLAVAIGTSHGAYKGKGRPFIDHPRLARIAELVPAPSSSTGRAPCPKSSWSASGPQGARSGRPRASTPRTSRRPSPWASPRSTPTPTCASPSPLLSGRPWGKTPRSLTPGSTWAPPGRR